MGHAFAGAEEHADHQPVVGRNALRPHADRKRTDAERKIPDADMAQRAAEFSAPELRYLDMGSPDRLVQALKTVEVGRIDLD
jgi:hypothetical protein